MLSKRKRVDKKLFLEVMKKGKVVPHSLFLLRYLKGEESRFAFVVPKSVSKKAVDRNKMRRIGYNTLNSIDILPKMTAIFFYKKEAKIATVAQLKSAIFSLLDKK